MKQQVLMERVQKIMWKIKLRSLMKVTTLNKFQCKLNNLILEEDATEDIHNYRVEVNAWLQIFKGEHTLSLGADKNCEFKSKLIYTSKT